MRSHWHDKNRLMEREERQREGRIKERSEGRKEEEG